jgi:hypothetical protein
MKPWTSDTNIQGSSMECCSTDVFVQYMLTNKKLEAQWAEPLSLTFPSVLRKLYIDRTFLQNFN